MSPAVVATKESLVSSFVFGTNRLPLRLGVSLAEVMAISGEQEDQMKEEKDEEEVAFKYSLTTMRCADSSKHHLIFIAGDGTIRVVLGKGATNRQIVVAFLHAFVIAKTGEKALASSKTASELRDQTFLSTLEKHHWNMNKLLLCDQGHRETWKVVAEKR